MLIDIALAFQKVIAEEKTVMVEQLQAQTNHLQNLNPEAIAQLITPLLTPINQELTRLRETQEKQQSTVHLLVKELRQELIEPVVERLDQSAKLTEQASLAVRELRQKNILPNQGINYFKIEEGKKGFLYNFSTGMPPLNEQQLKIRNKQLYYWQQDIRKLEKEARGFSF